MFDFEPLMPPHSRYGPVNDVRTRLGRAYERILSFDEVLEVHAYRPYAETKIQSSKWTKPEDDPETVAFRDREKRLEDIMASIVPFKRALITELAAAKKEDQELRRVLS